MPEFSTPIGKDEALRRIEEFANDPNEERLPAMLRERLMVRLSMVERTADTFTLHFGIRRPGKTGMSRYVDGRVAAKGSGSTVAFTLRAALSPRIAVSMVLGLVLLQDIYELIRGSFSRFNAVFTVVAPTVAGLLALLEKRSISRSFDAGLTDALRQAVLRADSGAGAR